MTDRPPVNFELAILLPLGVLANQLMKVEADLRLLNAKTLAYAEEGQATGPANLVTTRLEKINESLDVIRGLMADIETNMQSSSEAVARKPRTDRDD